MTKLSRDKDANSQTRQMPPELFILLKLCKRTAYTAAAGLVAIIAAAATVNIAYKQCRVQYSLLPGEDVEECKE